MTTDHERGLYGRYRVERIGGTPGKHTDCYYYVLDLEHDAFALPALRAYADACRDTYPALAHDLDSLVANRERRVVGREAGRAVQDDGPLFAPDAEHCHECGRAVGLVWTAPDDLWAAVTGRDDGGGILCPACFDRKATEQGRFIRWVPQQEIPTEGRDNPVVGAVQDPLHDPQEPER